MLASVALTLVDGVRVVVPDSLDLITPYVLREQQDFFEDELPFVRRVLQPGENVIDIGANYGVYTLPMAQKVGPSGHVWAFEPASSTAQFLAQGIAANGFGNVTLEQKAVSSAPGGAQLSVHRHSELRSIVHGAAPPGGSEDVLLVTLDGCMDSFRWRDIDLIKIDAEGEEVNIVRGGSRFFAQLSPLVQYELRKDATDINFGLVRDFAAIGYDSYRLVPGLGLLVPFDAESTPDPYLLNLFCCNTTRADRLAARELLLRRADLRGSEGTLGPFSNRSEDGGKYHWHHALAHMPYAASLAPVWEMAEKAGESATVHRALSFYARSLDCALPISERFRALEASFVQFKKLCESDPSRLRLASLARIAHDYGERAVAVKALAQLVERIQQTGAVDPNEPFLAPLERFDTISPGEALGTWFFAAVLEHLERRERFSSFYAGASAIDRLEAIRGLGYGSPEMGRRLELVRTCIDRARGAQA